MNQRTTKFLKQLYSETRRYEQLVVEMYMKRLTPPSWGNETTEADRRKYVMKLIARGDQPFDEWMMAEEAVAAGLIQEITTERLNIFPGS
jgi:ATP-dependent protease ClpP protease subunit